MLNGLWFRVSMQTISNCPFNTAINVRIQYHNTNGYPPKVKSWIHTPFNVKSWIRHCIMNTFKEQYSNIYICLLWRWHPSPPCVLRTALFWHCVLQTAIFLPRVLRTVLQQKTTILAVSIYIKKLKLQYVVCTCTLILENISFDVFAC